MDPIEERLQQGLRKVAAFTAAMRVMDEGVRATEASSADGAVTVQVDAAGAVTAILLDDAWRARVAGPLGTAVVEAYQTARRSQVVAGLENVARLPDRLDDVPVLPEDLAAATRPPVDLAELQRSLPSLAEVNAQLAEAIAGARRVRETASAAPAAAPAEPVGGDDVEVVLDAAGGIVACTVPETWQRSAPLPRLLEALNRPFETRETQP
ncbi:hypothetical protein [Auraticoccus monumenti]|uniref:YbaB/EbfC DNA-binding family protein n=1 Tax=Auraticoccus monumenti TaxID=675864 RepID=A0A1G6Y9G4_9ACTN|nr:hypothetical protein [Auraticoccus monumenti]SDD86891.1 hypothetical protein SAMN04489747_1936 [Auraticoccus monumenti]